LAKEELQMAEPGKDTSTGQAPSGVGRVALIVDVTTGEIVKFEAVDAAGVRRELSQNERAELAKAGPDAVEDLIERAFEAGIASVLDGEVGSDDEQETEKEAAVRRMLLKPLMEKSVAAGALRRKAVRLAIVASLIRHAAAAGEAEEKKALKPDRTAPKSST
jgi:hypothetical protein